MRAEATHEQDEVDASVSGRQQYFALRGVSMVIANFFRLKQ